METPVGPTPASACVDSSFDETVCPVCSVEFTHPVRLPCSHIFCFECSKGFINRSKRCALCRQPISPSYLNRPDYVHPITRSQEGTSSQSPDRESGSEVPCATDRQCSNDSKSSEGAYGTDSSTQAPVGDTPRWYYKARRGGWWQYVQKHTKEIESHWQEDPTQSFDMMLAGYMYTINFQDMVQYRKTDPNVRREIRRDSTGELAGEAEVRGEGGVTYTTQSAPAPSHPGGDGLSQSREDTGSTDNSV